MFLIFNNDPTETGFCIINFLKMYLITGNKTLLHKSVLYNLYKHLYYFLNFQRIVTIFKSKNWNYIFELYKTM